MKKYFYTLLDTVVLYSSPLENKLSDSLLKSNLVCTELLYFQRLILIQ